MKFIKLAFSLPYFKPHSRELQHPNQDPVGMLKSKNHQFYHRLWFMNDTTCDMFKLV